MNRIIITNGKFIFPDKIQGNCYIIIENGIISSIGEGQITPKTNDILINARNSYISPGFIDIHVHGGGGYDLWMLRSKLTSI